jgi:large subunit ribosomal protein L23
MATATKKTETKAEEKSMQELYQEGSAKSEAGAVKEPRAYCVLVKPLITEKASVLASQNKYVFVVKKDTNKVEVMKAVSEVYGVKPTTVNMIRMEGKDVRYGRYSGKRSDWKKAIVTLPAGKTIQVYEGV